MGIQAARSDESDHNLRCIYFFAKFYLCVHADRQAIPINSATPNLIGHQTQACCQQINEGECKGRSPSRCPLALTVDRSGFFQERCYS